MRQTLQSLDSNKDGIISPKVLLTYQLSINKCLGAVVWNNEENSYREKVL